MHRSGRADWAPTRRWGLRGVLRVKPPSEKEIDRVAEGPPWSACSRSSAGSIFEQQLQAPCYFNHTYDMNFSGNEVASVPARAGAPAAPSNPIAIGWGIASGRAELGETAVLSHGARYPELAGARARMLSWRRFRRGMGLSADVAVAIIFSVSNSSRFVGGRSRRNGGEEVLMRPRSPIKRYAYNH